MPAPVKAMLASALVSQVIIAITYYLIDCKITHEILYFVSGKILRV
jgi:hypothetical protein